jgi:hypothetical protein
MASVRETLGTAGFPQGVVLATDASLLGPEASPRGWNSALALATAGIPYVQKRMGLRCMNRTPISGSPTMLGGYGYRRVADDTDYHLMLDALGRLTNRNAADNFGTVTTVFTAGVHYPDWATANDLCFVVNGVDRYKFDGTVVTNFGIDRPTVGTMAGAAGAAGLHNGTYELRVTYGNSSTGHESSASDTATATVTVTNDAIDWSNVPVSADTQVDRRYLYARNIATQVQFYRVGTIANNTATTATTSVLDANAIIPAPSTTGRDRVPSGVKYLAYHQGRLFAASDSYLYWSDIDAPEAFGALSLDGINAGDGEAITGIWSDGDVLLVLKEGRVYGIFNGNNPLTWQVREIDAHHGCVSHRTIVSANQHVYWYSRTGLVRFNGVSVEAVGERYLGDLSDSINAEQWLTASAAHDDTQNRLMVALPGTSQLRATFILPFHTTLERFEASFWDPMDVGTLHTAVDSGGVQRVWLGNYAGQLFKTWDTNNDGVVEGTVTGQWVADAESASTFNGLTTFDTDGVTVIPATFDTTGGGLIERKVLWVDSEGEPVSDTRRYITTNSSNDLTMNAATAGFTIGETYTYIIGGPDFQFDTPWRTFGLPWVKKRHEYFHLLVKGINYGASATITLAFDYDDANANSKERVLTTGNVSGVWDDAIWDADVWDTAANVRTRSRVARTGFSWRARIRNSEANQPFALLMCGMDAATQTGKR